MVYSNLLTVALLMFNTQAEAKSQNPRILKAQVLYDTTFNYKACDSAGLIKVKNLCYKDGHWQNVPDIACAGFLKQATEIVVENVILFGDSPERMTRFLIYYGIENFFPQAVSQLQLPKHFKKEEGPELKNLLHQIYQKMTTVIPTEWKKRYIRDVIEPYKPEAVLHSFFLNAFGTFVTLQCKDPSKGKNPQK